MADTEYQAAVHRLRYELPPMPPLRVLVQWREAGVFDPRRLYSSETVFLLSGMRELARRVAHG